MLHRPHLGRDARSTCPWHWKCAYSPMGCPPWGVCKCGAGSVSISPLATTSADAGPSWGSAPASYARAQQESKTRLWAFVLWISQINAAERALS